MCLLWNVFVCSSFNCSCQRSSCTCDFCRAYFILRRTPRPASAPEILPPGSLVKILKWIPKASREQCGKKLATILDASVITNDHVTWDRLLRFSPRCLSTPRRGDKRRSLASAVNRQLTEEADTPTIAAATTGTRRRVGKAPLPVSHPIPGNWSFTEAGGGRFQR